ncbi:MAG: hypothetical protein JW745_02020 [Sedimentisphaerales bacterium]|nr:hypothetical protein [Sedimentisphaerales bacterium]MBN2842997.1 hypothetical protein [Sedimentisphaerales bacterium]
MTDLDKDTNKGRFISVLLLAIFSYLLVIFAALHSADKPVGGGDTWVAMACGRYFLNDWATKDQDRTVQMKVLDLFGVHLSWNDPFSVNSRPYAKGIEDCEGWVNQNWLSHILFYEMKMNLGEGSIVVYKFIQAILTALFAFWAARALKVNYFLAAACAAFGVLLARSYIDMRPNISTILMAIILITILFRWKAGKVRDMLWLFPVMIIWSNIHGGFIYGIVVLALACGGYAVTNILSHVNPAAFEFHPWKEKYKWLLIGFGISVLTPMIFSPYGAENLLHPLMIMFGHDGKEWRNVSEWHPLFGTGFGNTGSFIVFGIIFILLAIVWLFLRLRYKMPVPVAAIAGAEDKEPSASEYKYLPSIDLSWLAIILLTFHMAISSRRFVFLAGVVLAPFMAVMLQQIFIMSQNFWQRVVSKAKADMAAIVAALSGSIIFAVIFIAAMTDIYFSPSADGNDFTIFRRMVGILDQPVLAGEFFDANKVRGVVLNEWTNGGYISWTQTPDQQTGRPACKVYIDGRAQAAYRLSHFQKWQAMNINVVGAPEQVDQDLKNRKNFLARLYQQTGINPAAANACDQLIERCRGNKDSFTSLMYAMGADPKLYGKMLEQEKITVVLAKNGNSSRTINYLQSLDSWRTLFVDDRYTVIFRINAPENRQLLDTPAEELIYPDDFTRNLSLGDYYKTSSDKGEAYRAKLIKAEAFYADIEAGKRVHAYISIYQVMAMLDKKAQLKDFFLAEYDRLKPIIESNEPLGRMNNLVAIHTVCHYLTILTDRENDSKAAGEFARQKNEYGQMIESQRKAVESRLFW